MFTTVVATLTLKRGGGGESLYVLFANNLNITKQNSKAITDLILHFKCTNYTTSYLIVSKSQPANALISQVFLKEAPITTVL